ncbi:thioredoxin reductase [Catalinimonas alkaloidigena]|uniref:lycopene cyclase family protein n=1 Tax=Catalinimonas alkaloidigena TaxID=1075417 RepID=UPI00240677A7|nr:lycopene cyclase family protein [Catalinimonas alkaloidigena]MDF9796215.1 thioredoxin reductase [Catalinimonas alkaloidigena]
MSFFKSYDYIIAGGGAAGLSLLFHCLQSALKEKTFLVIDNSSKETNDRTWCFWEVGDGIFENIVHHQWQQLDFYSASFSKSLDIAPYSYKMIRGIDFYSHVKKSVATLENIHFLQSEVLSIIDTEEGAVVKTDKGSFNAKWVFNSIREKDEREQAEAYHYLLQHF